MNARTRQYLFGSIFHGIGIFQLITRDFLEAALYGTAGLAFVFNTLTSEPRLLPYKKALVVVTWILIAVTGVLFLYLLQFKYL